MSAADLIKEFSRYYFQDRHASIRTCASYEESLQFFFNHTKKNIEEIGPHDINQYIGELKAAGQANNTMRLRQVAIRMFFDWYVRNINPQHDHPALNLIQIREEVKIPIILSPEDIMRMVYVQDLSKFIGRRDAALICMLADTGIRKSEAALLKMGNVQKRENNFLLLVPRIKSFERQVPFALLKENEFISEYFTAYYAERKISQMTRDNEPLFITDGPLHKGNQMTAQTISKVVKRAAKRAGIEKNVSVHSFRHFYGTYLYINGTDIMQIKDLMGHALLETTQRYIHIASSVTGKVLKTGATKGFDRAPISISGFVKIIKQMQTEPRKQGT